MTRIVLGSSSATRSAILTAMGIVFEVAKPNIDEKAIRFQDPAELVLAIGKAKATALLTGKRGDEFKRDGALLITSDQVVVCNGQILEKPEDEAEARRFIEGYGTHAAETVGSCIVTDAASGSQWAHVDVARVHFSPISDEAIDKLIVEGDVFYCAGGLMVEHPLVEKFITKMEGDIDTVQGLSSVTARRLLDEAIAARAS